MRYVNGELILNKAEIKDFELTLFVLEQNQNIYGDKKLDKDSVNAYRTMRHIAVRLGVIA
jgi:hypothetical protein